MRNVLLALALCLLAAPAWATWTRIGTFAVGNDTTQDTSLVVATSATLEAGNVGICVIASDEGGAGTTNGDSGEIVSVVDAAGNVWIEAIEFCNMQSSTINNGACVAVWWTRAATQLTSGANITVTLLDVATDPRKALTCDEFTISGNDVSMAPGKNGIQNDAANVGSMTDATGVSVAHLFIRASACESNNTGYGADADYVAYGGSTTTSTANTGTAATSMGARGESRIATEATSAASDPDYPSSAGTADCGSAMIALDEQTITPAGGTFGKTWQTDAGALKFGTVASDRVDCASPTAFDNQTVYSFGMIAKTDSFSATFPALMGKGTATTGWFLYQSNAANGNLVMDHTGATSLRYRSNNAPLKVGRWQFLATTVDHAGGAGNEAHIYVSSDLLSPLSEVTYDTQTDIATPDADAADPLAVGNDGGFSSAHLGSIVLAFFSPGVSLTRAELLEWQQNPLSPPRGCQGLWRIGHNGRGAVSDYSGQSNEGTITGAIPVEGIRLFERRAFRASRVAAAAAAELLNRLLMGVGK